MSYNDFTVDEYVQAAIARIDQGTKDFGQEPITALAASLVRSELRAMFAAGAMYEREQTVNAISSAKVEFPGGSSEPQAWFKRSEVLAIIDA